MLKRNNLAIIALLAGVGFSLLAGCSAVADLEPMDQSELQNEAKLPTIDGLEGYCPVLDRGLVSGHALPPVKEHRLCGHPYPYAVTAINGRYPIAFSREAKINCVMATQLQRFFAEQVQPMALDILGQPISEMRVAASYSCRNRNHKRRGKLSEHGKMNAIDISALTLADGQILTVEGDWRSFGKKGRFMRGFNRAACRYFTTVIGPGGDKYHQNHFHLDHARHGRKGTWRVCQ